MKENVKNAIRITFNVLLIMWLVMIFTRFIPIVFGIIPREISLRSFLGIVLAPFFHGSWAHIISNTIPLVVLLFALYSFHPRLATRVVLLSIILGGGLVWLAARGNSCHIGASGLIFSLIGFMVANFLFRREFKSFLIGGIIGFFYGLPAVMGIIPGDPGISWEGHLFGMAVGIYLSYKLRHVPSH